MKLNNFSCQQGSGFTRSIGIKDTEAACISKSTLIFYRALYNINVYMYITGEYYYVLDVYYYYYLYILLLLIIIITREKPLYNISLNNCYLREISL